MYEALKKDKVFSPFPTGTPVRGENLIGREDEISQIIKLLQNLLTPTIANWSVNLF